MLKANQNLKKGERLKEVSYKGKIFKVKPLQLRQPDVTVKDMAMGKRLSRRPDTA